MLLLVKFKVFTLSRIYIPLPDGHSANVLGIDVGHGDQDGGLLVFWLPTRDIIPWPLTESQS